IGNNKDALWKQSFEIGGLRLLELFSYHDPILPGEVEELMAYFDKQLTPLVAAIQKYNPREFIGASGTFDTLTDMYYASFQRPKLKDKNSSVLPRVEFERMLQKLLSLNKAERLKIPGMIPMRVDMIVVAVCLIENVLKHFDVGEL